MASLFDTAFIQARIDELKAELTTIVTSIASAQTASQYSIDTGQTRQSVSRQSLGQLQNRRNAILSELAYWDALLNNGVATRIVPGW